MAANQALKQYIAARKQLFDASKTPITVVDTIRHIKSMPMYKKMDYYYLHKNISRIFDRIDNNGTPKTPYKRKNATRTKKMIKMVANIHKKTKGTKKCSQRKIAETIHKKIPNSKIAPSTVRTI
eukprot:244986_1